jgi:CubicO group peptidase (beta-lactamase class C family)
VNGFDAAGFIQELKAKLTGNVAGFSIGLNENGSTIGQATQNWAKWQMDGIEAEAWTLDTRMNVASLSKIVTAIAMTKLLGEAGISPGTPIIGYLPAYWVKGPNVDQITFADLLANTSGLAFNDMTSEMDLPFMREQIALGIETANLGQYEYQNLNYGLCRILVATVNGNVPLSLLVWPTKSSPVTPAEFNDNAWDSSTISAYASYVASEVFAPSGVSGPGFTYDAADALAYNFPVTSSWNFGDQTGVTGWYMSVNELLRVMGTFRRGGTIVSPTQAQLMLDNGFGINQPPVPTTLGTYYVKFGGLQQNPGYEYQGLAFFLPLNMELVILVNSPVRGELIVNGIAQGNVLYSWVQSAYMNHIV